MAKEFQISDTSDTVDEKSKDEKLEKEETTEKPAEKEEVKEKKEEKVKEEKPKEKKKLFENFNWKKLLFPTAAVLTLVGIGLFYYFGIFKFKPTPIHEILTLNEMFVESAPFSTLRKSLPLLSKPNEPRTEVSPLNGLLFSKNEMDEMKKRRPVAVMTNNHVEARPLSGLNSADIVIEANAESGITRLLAIYWSKAPEKVGPIRSLRQSYLEWASEYDPLLIYDGCAQTDNPKTNACGNVHTYSMRIIGTIGAWRSAEGGRVAPHNEYSSVKNAWSYGERVNWDNFPSSFGKWEFKKDADVKERGSKTVVRTLFHTRLSNGGLYDVIWRYDNSTNTYLREVGGKIDTDAETNTQVSAKVVVIQEVNVTPSGDDKGRLITTTTGEGDAVILQDGKIQNGKWKKDSRTDRTKYYDSSGNIIKLNRGRIWISMIPHSDGKFDIIEQ
ncbi:MAG: DUF3048 domain-containing protein [Candidatus Dojkabacteria bacterium]|nr:DUF3048 domain-containing protein [Candidatus Dojkabacteria bacterium]MDD4561315.1 DUF3048 domain-containing protein [Candidatus Dojkabacteria bacterium]